MMLHFAVSPLSLQNYQAFLFEFGPGLWTQLPNMAHSHRHGACGRINNPDNGVEIVVVSGTDTAASEIFSFDDLTWRFGPNVPEPRIYRSQSIQAANR